MAGYAEEFKHEAVRLLIFWKKAYKGTGDGIGH